MFWRGLQGGDFAGAGTHAQAGNELGLCGHLIAFGAHKVLAFKGHHQLACLYVFARPLQGEHIVPAVGVEQAGDQGGAQDVAHLLAAHAGLQCLHLLARDEVALHHGNLVGLEGFNQLTPR